MGWIRVRGLGQVCLERPGSFSSHEADDSSTLNPVVMVGPGAVVVERVLLRKYHAPKPMLRVKRGP